MHIRLARPPTRPLRPIIPNNARPPCITAAAGTGLAGASSPGTVKGGGHCPPRPFFPGDRVLRPEGLRHPRGVAASGSRPLRKIPHCCLPQESGPCLSPSVAVRPLRPATDRRLGGPSPRQQANRARAPPPAPGPSRGPRLSPAASKPPAPCGIIAPFGTLSPSGGQVAHVLLTRLPCAFPHIRLACVRHAASVHSEPGSNSPKRVMNLVDS